MATRLSWMPEPMVKIASAGRSDLEQFILGGVWLGPVATVRAWKVNPDYSNAGEIAFGDDPTAKDDAVTFRVRHDGALEVIVGEALPNASGSTTEPVVYLVPGVFPAAPASSGVVDVWLRARVSAFMIGLRDLAARFV